MRRFLYLLQLCGYKNREFLLSVKKPTTGAVKWTKRAKRIYVTAVVLCVLGVGLPLLFRARTVAAANWLLTPIEKCIRAKWLRRAKRKLNRPEYKELIKIGITGSFGKTSCKNILAAILAAEYRVVASKASYNTPMGFARTVNEDLTPDTEVLIMEMGARKRGDIAEMCRLVNPDYGMITAIGAAHLETFGTLENVRATKMELCDFVPYNNMVGPVPPPLSVYKTKLLGRHNQQNIDLCVQMAKKLGITDENIMAAVAGLKPTPHRLELVEAPNGIKILDDAYNSNPTGAVIALEVLSAFTGRHVVQTAGFVEAGAAAVELNRELGVQIAAVADAVIITGELNKTAIAEGLLSAGYPAEKTYFAQNTEKAKSLYPRLLSAGDTLLIENDLPENY